VNRFFSFIPYWVTVMVILTCCVSQVCSMSADPEQPRVFLNTAYPTNTRPLIYVNTGQELQEAIDDAVPGDTIMVAPGVTFTAPGGYNFTLRNKPNPNKQWIIIRSASSAFDTTGSIPPGRRVNGLDSAQNAQMPKLRGGLADVPVITTESHANFYRLVGLDVAPSSNLTTHQITIDLGEGSRFEESTMPTDIVIDRCYVHGYDTGYYKRGVSLSGKRMAVIDSYISNYHWWNDSQAIFGGYGPGPYKIVNNYLEAASENIMFGGADPAIIGMVPSDIEVQYNYMSKPLSWMSRDDIRNIKNSFELKNARRILINGNIFENVPDLAIWLKSVNQEGTCSWCVSEHITFTNNIVRNARGGILFSAQEKYERGAAPIPLNHIKVENCLFYNIGVEPWGSFRMFYFSGNSNNVELSHITAESGDSATIYVADQASQNVPNFTLRNNILERRSYGLGVANEGTGTLNNNFYPYSYAKNVIINRSAGTDQALDDDSLRSRYPSLETFLVPSRESVKYVDRAGGNYRLASDSPHKNSATDGKDIGCDIDALENATRGVISGQGGASNIRTNVALASNGGVASASSSSSGYAVTNVNDGKRTSQYIASTNQIFYWADATPGSNPDWVQVTFNGQKSIDEIDIFSVQDWPGAESEEPTETMTGTKYVATDFEVQYWTGSAWATVPGGNVVGNNKIWRKFTFSPITTSKIRLLIHKSPNPYSYNAEIMAFGTDAAPLPTKTNIALASNGGVASASSSSSGYSVANVNDGKRTSQYIASTNQIFYWADATPGVSPDWVQVAFNGQKSIDEIDIFSVQDWPGAESEEPTETMTGTKYVATDFEVQYWTGSAWATVPGGNVAGNSKIWRKFTFSPITTSKIRLLIHRSPNPYSYNAEIEAYSSSN
jgi:hypothetical protein